MNPVPYARSLFIDDEEELLIFSKRLLLCFRRRRRSDGAVKNVRRPNLFGGNVRDMSRYEDEDEDEMDSAPERIPDGSS